jgi:hypothetical protein
MGVFVTKNEFCHCEDDPVTNIVTRVVTLASYQTHLINGKIITMDPLRP